MNKAVIIVAGGSGTRMGSSIPKQFLILHNKPVLMHTISRFFHALHGITIVVVLPKVNMDYWMAICDEYYFDVPFILAEGGENRFESVKNGLAKLDHFDGLIGVHDGVRPLVSADTILQCYHHAELNGNAIPCLPSIESVRIINEDKNESVPRDTIMMIQTPQVFQSQQIFNAYQQPYSPEFTDDASVIEKTGIPIHLCHGNKENIKITCADDLLYATELVKKETGNNC